MFAITSTRIVGLTAVVCAVVVAPQALAAPSTQSRIAPPDAIEADDVSGFDLNDLKNGRDPFTAATHKSVKATSKSGTAAWFVYKSMNPGWGAAATAAKKLTTGPTPAAAVKTAPVVCNGQADYDYVYSGCEG